MNKALTGQQCAFVLEYQRHEDIDRAFGASGITPIEIPKNGYYVYFLVDPRFNSIFYIGKGKRNRVRIHEAAVISRRSTKYPKDKRIADVHSEGHTVRTIIFAAYESESEAYAVEAELIAGFRDCDGIANLCGVRTEDAMERQVRFADSMLKRLIPFELWVEFAGPEILGFAAKNSGSARAFYDKFVENVQRLKTEPIMREIVVVERSA